MPVGRPRAFCTEKALDSALTVFWKKGYEGTSLPDLTEAMGINRPSMYAAFGNKESLFMKALERYKEKSACVAQMLDTPRLYDGVQALLRKTVEKITDPDSPHGCLSINAALACSEETDRIKQALEQHRHNTQNLIRERCERARNEGDLPANTQPEALARYITTVMQGLSVQATGGASREALLDVVDLSMQAWPK